MSISRRTAQFTGEISVEMLKDLGVKFCLTGHSERRHVLKEPPELVAKKAAAIYAGGLILIHCVGEKLEERDANKTLAGRRSAARRVEASDDAAIRIGW